MQVKSSFPENEEISAINCTVSSIAQICYTLDTTGELLTNLMTEASRIRLTKSNVESWLSKTVPGREFDSDITQTFNSVVLHPNTFIKCTIPVNATAAHIECVEDF